ncbi:Tll0287-like domain-containing protein [Sulfurimonas sp.]|uniref:Tll0287-like domain-containing protein n=1 Tax=Sulfurimonas sp. TaxID=2022749 RepID=UPI003D0EE40F
MMKFFSSITLVTLSSISLLANDTANLTDVMQKGSASTKLLMQTLGKNMKMHMKQGGAMEALDFCSEEAYNLTEAVNKKLPEGVSVKRVSLLTRNPVNTPSEDEKKVLQHLQELQENNESLPKRIVEKMDAHTYKFYKPLVIDNEACLKCHGDVQNEKLKAEILNRYPEDKAMGYKMGDIRGAVVTTVKK